MVQAAAVRFEDQAGYNATVLDGAHITHPVALFAAGPTGVTAAGVLAGLGSAAGAVILAGLALYWRRLPLLRGYQPNAAIAAAARRFQSGVVNDYVTWTVLGLACLGGVLTLVIRLPGQRRRISRTWRGVIPLGTSLALARPVGVVGVRSRGQERGQESAARGENEEPGTSPGASPAIRRST